MFRSFYFEVIDHFVPVFVLREDVFIQPKEVEHGNSKSVISEMNLFSNHNVTNTGIVLTTYDKIKEKCGC